jgi:hypothetical protein
MYDAIGSSPSPFQKKFVQKLDFSNPKITLKSSKREMNIEYLHVTEFDILEWTKEMKNPQNPPTNNTPSHSPATKTSLTPLASTSPQKQFPAQKSPPLPKAKNAAFQTLNTLMTMIPQKLRSPSDLSNLK